MAAEKRTFLDKFTEFSVRLGNQVHLKVFVMRLRP